MVPDNEIDGYPFEIRRLDEDEGGGFLISFTDFYGCHSDGETVAEAIANGRLALQSTIDAMRKWGDTVPQPYSNAPKAQRQASSGG